MQGRGRKIFPVLQNAVPGSKKLSPGLSPLGWCSQSVKLTTYFSLLPRLTIDSALFPFLYVSVTYKITPWPCIHPRKVTMFDSCTITTKVMNAWSFTPALPIRLHGTLPSNNKLFHAMSERIGEGTIAPANPPKVYKDVEVQHHPFLSSELHGGDRSASRPIRCIPGAHLTADPTASRNATQNSALTDGRSSSWVTVLTDISRLPEKWLWLISVFFFYSSGSNGNISHRFKCPVGRTQSIAHLLAASRHLTHWRRGPPYLA